MRKTITLSDRATLLRRLCGATAQAGLVILAVACNSSGEPSTTGAPEQAGASASAVPTAAPSATTTDTAAAAVSASAEPTAAVAASASSGASAAPSASAAAGAAPSGSAAADAKTFDCGAKGQKPCPMQGWMKSVMASASSSGDAEKLASALSYVAGRPPPGMGNWVAMANAGVAKAKAGDIEGAKATCKQCHDSYKAKYKSTMRDRPF